MIQLLVFLVIPVACAAGLASLATAVVYRRRLGRIEDERDVAREAAEHAADRLRDFGAALASEPVPDFEKELAAAAVDLSSERALRRGLSRFNARHAGADLPKT